MGATKAIVSKAVTDPKFRRQLLENPKAAIEQELGIHLPPGVNIQVHENSGAVIHVVLPGPEIAIEQGLSERELDTVAGGFGIAPQGTTLPTVQPGLKPMPGGELLPPLLGGGGISPIGMGTFGKYTGCCS